MNIKGDKGGESAWEAQSRDKTFPVAGTPHLPSLTWSCGHRHHPSAELTTSQEHLLSFRYELSQWLLQNHQDKDTVLVFKQMHVTLNDGVTERGTRVLLGTEVCQDGLG